MEVEVVVEVKVEVEVEVEVDIDGWMGDGWVMGDGWMGDGRTGRQSRKKSCISNISQKLFDIFS